MKEAKCHIFRNTNANPTLAAVLKTKLSKEVRASHADEIRQYLLVNAFVSESYFIATTGTTLVEKVREYIDSQRSDDHKRKYEKSGKYSKKKQWRDATAPAIHPQPTVKW